MASENSSMGFCVLSLTLEKRETASLKILLKNLQEEMKGDMISHCQVLELA